MIIRGDARCIPLADESVQTVVTSPPYWGLRDYGIRGQIGLEPTPDVYVATMVEVFHEVKRVLRADGTVWLNLGDSYAGGGVKGSHEGTKQNTNRGGRWADNPALALLKADCGIPPKNLIGIPWRVAFALQADGWYLRSDIVWAKPAPMPESVTDRPTRAHEYIFLLAKSERYFYDAEAIMEPASETTHARTAEPRVISRATGKQDGHGRRYAGFNARWDERMNRRARAVNPKAELGRMGIEKQNGSFSTALADLVLERNKRTVWTVAAEPTPEAHFATFPQKLIEPCILAGSRTGDLVFDPFFGSGTVGKVAERFGRHWIGLEINPAYIGIAERNTAQLGLWNYAARQLELFSDFPETRRRPAELPEVSE